MHDSWIPQGQLIVTLRFRGTWPCKTWVHDSLNVSKDKSCTTSTFYILSYIIYRYMTSKLLKGVQGIASKYDHPNKHNGIKASKG